MFSGIYKNKKVAVLGHTGFKGSWLVTWLLELGAEVVCFSDTVPTEPSHFELLKLDERAKDVRGNIENFKEVSSFLSDEKPEIVFHLAANAIVSDCIENPIKAFETNLMGTVNVLESIRNTPSIRSAVMITSDKCYENVEWVFGYREDDRLGGKDPYSASKACAEIAFSSYFRTFLKQNKELKIASARAGNVIGGGDWAKDRIVPDCIRAWTNDTEVRIRSPKSTRPWQHVLEPLSGYLALGADLYNSETTVNGESFNFGPKANVNKSVQELIDEMENHWPAVRVEYDKDNLIKNKEASLLKLCCDKALFHLDWIPTLEFKETVEYTVNWYKLWHENPSEVGAMTVNQIQDYQNCAKCRGVAWAQK